MNKNCYKRIKSIDVLKFFAMLMVILVHSSQRIKELNECLFSFASIGEKGVQLFLLLSGFSVCLSWEREQGSSWFEKSRKFVFKRIKSILPMYFIFVLVWLVIICY